VTLSKVVIDTNVWISALLHPLGNPRKIADLFEEDAFLLFCSQELIDELVDVVHRPRIATRINQDQADRLTDFIKTTATFVKLKNIHSVSPDPKDDMFLACAATGQCDFLVTGNRKDLLDLGSYKQTKIVNPAQFFQIIKRQL
jgi:putative PIN family toxin of toxin-antitoxin system